MKKTLFSLVISVVVMTLSSALAEDMNGADLSATRSDQYYPTELSGTLKKVHEANEITIGYRDASFPFSYVRPDRPVPYGYSIDLCKGVVDEIVRELHGQPVRIAYRLVTSDSRMGAVTSGLVDLECGSTTSNLERQNSVAFSPVMFVAGTKLLVKQAADIHSYRDLGGKTLVVTLGTTNAAVMNSLNDKYKLGINIITASDHEQSYEMLDGGKADAFATDDVLLYGFIASKRAEKTMTVVGDYITYEPYGVMFRRDDPQMAEGVSRGFKAMANQRRLVSIYHKWFMQPTPTGENLNLPPSLHLTEVWRSLGLDDF